MAERIVVDDPKLKKRKPVSSPAPAKTAMPPMKPDEEVQVSMQAAIDDILRRQEGLSNEEIPAITIAELIKAYPEHADALSEAQARKLLSREYLKKAGVLRKSAADLKAEHERLVARSVRNADKTELMAVWLGSNLPSEIDRGTDDAGLLPANIVSVRVFGDEEVVEETHACLQAKTDDAERVKRLMLEELKAPNVVVEFNADSEYKRHRLISARVLETRLLRVETLLYMLWRAGVISDDDLGVSDTWRTRFAEALAGEFQW